MANSKSEGTAGKKAGTAKAKAAPKGKTPGKTPAPKTASSKSAAVEKKISAATALSKAEKVLDEASAPDTSGNEITMANPSTPDLPEKAAKNAQPEVLPEVAVSEVMASQTSKAPLQEPDREKAEASPKKPAIAEAQEAGADIPESEAEAVKHDAADEFMPNGHTAEGTGKPTLTREELFRAWWKAARPPFYIATLVPLFLGYFAARNDIGSPSLLVFTGVLLVGFLLHLCANLANDLFDYLLGTDTKETIGGSRGLQDGTISVRQLKLALAGCYGLVALFTLLGVWITGLWGLMFIALFGALASYYYVAPPIMYGYRALGEFFVFISMGVFMVGGSYYALAGELPSYVLALSMPVGLGVAGILYYQSLPEIETDAAMGKKTLVGVLGPEKAVFLFKLWWPAIWFLVIMLYLANLAAWPALIGIVLGIPMLRKASRRIAEFNGDWFSLDQYGKYTRIMYMSMGVFLVIGVAVL